MGMLSAHKIAWTRRGGPAPWNSSTRGTRGRPWEGALWQARGHPPEMKDTQAPRLAACDTVRRRSGSPRSLRAGTRHPQGVPSPIVHRIRIRKRLQEVSPRESSRRNKATCGASLIQLPLTDQPVSAASPANISTGNLYEFSVRSRSPLPNAKVWLAMLTVCSLRLTRFISMRLGRIPQRQVIEGLRVKIARRVRD